MSDLVTITAGPFTVELAPAAGGSIARYIERTAKGERHWMRPASAEAIARRDPIGMASFPLVPYSNRIRDGRFPLAGDTVVLPLNRPPERHALHGDGWLNPWTVTAADAASAELAFDWSRVDRPMRYTARQRFALHGRELINDVEVTNRGARPMPAGIGVHPWFPLTPRARMKAATPEVWLVDEEYMPTGRQAPPERLDFTPGLAFAGSNVANCYSGWDGRAVIEWPEHEMRLTMLAGPPLTHLVLYAPDGGDFFCVEPVSNAVDAFNLGPQGVPNVGYRLLEPGETLAGRVRFVTEVIGAGGAHRRDHP